MHFFVCQAAHNSIGNEFPSTAQTHQPILNALSLFAGILKERRRLQGHLRIGDMDIRSINRDIRSITGFTRIQFFYLPRN